MRIGVSRKSRNSLSSRIAGRMISSLLRSEPERDLADDRQLALGVQPVHVLRRDRGVVDDDAGGLHAGPAGRRPDVVDRGGGGLGQHRDVVQQGYESTRHGRSFPSVRTRPVPGRGASPNPSPALAPLGVQRQREVDGGEVGDGELPGQPRQPAVGLRLARARPGRSPGRCAPRRCAAPAPWPRRPTAAPAPPRRRRPPAAASRMVSSRRRRPASSARSRKKSSPSLAVPAARRGRRRPPPAGRAAGSRARAGRRAWPAGRRCGRQRRPASGPSAAMTGSESSSSRASVFAGLMKVGAAGPHSCAVASSAAAVVSGSATSPGSSPRSEASRSIGVSSDHSVVCRTREAGRATYGARAIEQAAASGASSAPMPSSETPRRAAS